jgi:hypothetical protein
LNDEKYQSTKHEWWFTYHSNFKKNPEWCIEQKAKFIVENGIKLVFTKIRKYITSYVYSKLEVVYTDEENGRAAKNMQCYISTHITQAVLWCIQGRIYKCFQQKSDFLRLKYNQQNNIGSQFCSRSYPKIPRKIYTTWCRFQTWYSTSL